MSLVFDRAVCALPLQALGLLMLAATRSLHATRGKWFLRAMPTFVLGCSLPTTWQALYAAPHGYVWLAQASLAALASGVLLSYRRRTPFRGPCESCPQRTMPICDGLRRAVQRERALHRLSGQLIARAKLSR